MTVPLWRPAEHHLRLVILGMGTTSWSTGRRRAFPGQPYAVLGQVTDGSLVHRLAGRRIRLQPGLLIAIPPQTPWEVLAESDATVLFADFDVRDAFDHSLLSRWWDGPLVVERPGAPLPALVACHGSAPADLARAQALAWDLLAPFLPAQAHAEPATGLEPLLAWIGAHLSQQLDLATLARVGGCSRQRLDERFRAAFGLPPMAWIRHRRIIVAQDLLLTTAMPVAAVAAAVSPWDIFQFSRCFRRITGLGPRAWRREVRGRCAAPPA
jgi:AraC-like DNA-binding protein